MKNTQTGTTLSSRLLRVFSLTSRESSEALILGTHLHTAVSLVCTYCIVDISDCFPVVPLIGFISFPWKSKQTDVSIPAVGLRL